MLNNFLRLLRDIRFRNGELLYDMATKLNINPSDLSYIETGKIFVDDKFLGKIKELYTLSDKEFLELKEAAQSVYKVEELF